MQSPAMACCSHRRTSTQSQLWRPRGFGPRTQQPCNRVRTGQQDADLASRPAAQELVEQIVEGIKDTDGGDNVTLEQRKAIDGSILQLEAIGAEQQVCQRRCCAASCGPARQLPDYGPAFVEPPSAAEAAGQRSHIWQL